MTNGWWLRSAAWVLGVFLLTSGPTLAQEPQNDAGGAPETISPGATESAVETDESASETDFLLVCDGNQCAAGMLAGQVAVCPFLDGSAPGATSFPEECPCDTYEITAAQEQTDGQEGNFILYGPNCETTGPVNVQPTLLVELAEVLGQGGALPPPSQIASLNTPSPPTTPTTPTTPTQPTVEPRPASPQ